MYHSLFGIHKPDILPLFLRQNQNLHRNIDKLNNLLHYSFLINLSKSLLHLGHNSYVLSKNLYLRTFLISRHISLSSKVGTISPQHPTCLNLTSFQLLGIISFPHLSQVCHSLLCFIVNFLPNSAKFLECFLVYQ